MYIVESKTKIKFNNSRLLKDLVASSVEKILVNNDVKVHELIRDEIYRRHRSNFTSCYEHPEYLGSILKEYFGNNAETIVESISKDLHDNYDVQIFLNKLIKCI